MSTNSRTSVPTRIPSGARRLPFLRKRSKNKDSRQGQSPVSPVDSATQKRSLQQEETWPDLNAAAVSSDGEDVSQDEVAEIQQPQSLTRETGLEHEQEQFSFFHETSQEGSSYDLKPPPPTKSHANIEFLAGRLFSVDHLDAILSDHVSSSCLARFLNTYQPRSAEVLKHYADSKKAVLAVEYANSLAARLHTSSERRPELAATLDRGFQAQMNQQIQVLVNDALPAYITHRLTQVVTDHLVKEITQNSAPIMRELIPNLAEVYCMTDPSLPDNPIVYASQGNSRAVNSVEALLIPSRVLQRIAVRS